MITSVGNPQVKKLRSLATDKRERRRERSFLLEGVRLVATALAAGAELHSVLFDPKQLAATTAGQELLTQVEQLPNSFAVTPNVLSAAADTVTPQGIVAAAAWPALAPQAPGIVLVLDAVQDPGNVGTLLRSAEAVGVAQVLCIRGTADVYSPKVVRSAMGAHFYLPLQVDLEWDGVAEMLAAIPQVYAASAHSHMPYYAADWRQPCALLIGNETAGLSAEAQASATRQIAIPMAGRSESLNAAVAGSVILFEALRQRTRGRT